MQPSLQEQEEWPLQEWYELRSAWLAMSAKVLVVQAGLLAAVGSWLTSKLLPDQGMWGAIVAAAAVLMWAQMTGALSQVFLRQGYQRLSTRLNASDRRSTILGTELLVAVVVGTVLSTPLVFGWVFVPRPLVLQGAAAILTANLLYGLLLSWALERRRHDVLPPLLGPPSPPSPRGWIPNLEAGADEV